jgi:hypothetical protein
MHTQHVVHRNVLRNGHDQRHFRFGGLDNGVSCRFRGNEYRSGVALEVGYCFSDALKDR